MNKKTIVIYQYFEKDHTYVENFFHLLRFGYSELNDYLLIITGNYTIELPQYQNISYVFIENKNYDYGGYAWAIKNVVKIEQYDFFIFINSSVRGPYIPSYLSENWTECFTKLLINDVGLSGSVINILPEKSSLTKFYKNKFGGSEPFSHIESMVYAMPREVILYLIKNKFYDIIHTLTKDEAIRDYEIRLSQLILAGGWNMKCILPEYNVIDYRGAHHEVNPTSTNGDPVWNFSYFGRTPHPFELIFIKSARSLFTQSYLDRLAYSAMCNSLAPKFLENNPSYMKYVDSLNSSASSEGEVRFVPPKSMIRFVPKPLRPFFQ